MKTATAATLRALDQQLITEGGVPGLTLMERAGAGIAAQLLEALAIRPPAGRPITLVAGKGNNGGDVFVVARHLRAAGYAPEVLLAGRAAELRGDAAAALEAWQAVGGALSERPEPTDWQEPYPPAHFPAWIVDGLLGTGVSGAPRGVAAAAIEWIQRRRPPSQVLAVDLPSGLEPDTGRPHTPCVVADLTVTLGLPKTGFLTPTAQAVTGPIAVVPLGFPPAYLAAAALDDARELLCAADLQPLFPPRPRAAHKGAYGHALIIAGSPGFAGAAALACAGALASGTGLVSALVPAPLAPMVSHGQPEVMVHGGATDDQGRLVPAALARLPWNRFTAVLIGPGLGAHLGLRTLIADAAQRGQGPLVLDADALNAWAAEPAALRPYGPRLILTPHPGEMARLLHCDTKAVQAERPAAALALCRLTGACVVLKGAGTLITAPDHPLTQCPLGNPGMAKGGCGDLLAGLLTGLAARGLAPYDAARAAVYLHARAGDRAAWRHTEEALLPRHLLQEFPAAWRTITPA